MHVQLDNLCTGLLRQCRRTRVIERVASVSRTCLPHLRYSMPPQRQRSRPPYKTHSQVVNALVDNCCAITCRNVQKKSTCCNRLAVRGSIICSVNEHITYMSIIFRCVGLFGLY